MVVLKIIIQNILGLSVKHPKDLGKTVNSLLNNPKCLKEIETNLNKIKDNNALEELYKIIKEMDVIK